MSTARLPEGERARILVTGGAGFVGAEFVRAAVARYPEARITVLDALTYAGSRARLESVRDRITFVRGDVADADTVQACVAECDLVVHFAAESHNDHSLRDPAPFLHTNVVGTFTVLEAVRRHGVRLHHVSTDEVYGDLAVSDGTRFTATSAYNPSSPYSASKASADLLVRAWARSFAVRATVSQCSNNYGPFQHIEKFVARQITNILDDRRPQLYGDGSNVREWIHVEDHTSALWAILERGEPGRTYLIGSGLGHSNRAVLALILELTGRPPDWFDHVPDRAGHDRRYALDSAAVRTELGWQPRISDLRAGLAGVIGWYEANRSWWEGDKAAVEAGYRRR